MLNILLKNIREISRDKKLLLFSIFFPAFLLVTSHFFLARTQASLQAIPLAVVNPEPEYPKAGKLFVMALQRLQPAGATKPILDVRQETREEAMRLLHDGKVAGVLIIPEHFTQGLQAEKQTQKILFIPNENDWKSQILTLSFDAFAARFGFLVRKSQGKQTVDPVDISVVSGKGVQFYPEMESLASIFLFAFLFLIPYAGGQWVSEFEQGSFVRFRMAHVPFWQLFFGGFFSTLFLGFIQVFFLLLVAFGLGLRTNLFAAWVWPTAGVLALASFGFGLIFASFIEKGKQLNLISSFVLIPLYLLSGPFGEQMKNHDFLAYFPWHQGYIVLIDALTGKKVPPVKAGIDMLVVSFVLAVFGMSLFVVKRFRYG